MGLCVWVVVFLCVIAFVVFWGSFFRGRWGWGMVLGEMSISRVFVLACVHLLPVSPFSRIRPRSNQEEVIS